jgi:hypothetical protein
MQPVANNSAAKNMGTPVNLAIVCLPSNFVSVDHNCDFPTMELSVQPQLINKLGCATP